MDKDNHKLCERVQKHLNDNDDEDDVISGQVHVTGAWVSNNRRNVEMIFGTPNAINPKALSHRTLDKIVHGGTLTDTDKQDIINATKRPDASVLENDQSETL